MEAVAAPPIAGAAYPSMTSLITRQHPDVPQNLLHARDLLVKCDAGSHLDESGMPRPRASQSLPARQRRCRVLVAHGVGEGAVVGADGRTTLHPDHGVVSRQL